MPILSILSVKDPPWLAFAPLLSARLSSPETDTLWLGVSGRSADPFIQQSAALGLSDCGFRMEIIEVEIPALLRRTTTRSAWSRDSVVA
jgi:hypothetical protein